GGVPSPAAAPALRSPARRPGQLRPRIRGAGALDRRPGRGRGAVAPRPGDRGVLSGGGVGARAATVQPPPDPGPVPRPAWLPGARAAGAARAGPVDGRRLPALPEPDRSRRRGLLGAGGVRELSPDSYPRRVELRGAVAIVTGGAT